MLIAAAEESSSPVGLYIFTGVFPSYTPPTSCRGLVLSKQWSQSEK